MSPTLIMDAGYDFVYLTTGQVSAEQFDEPRAHKFFGGRGLTTVLNTEFHYFSVYYDGATRDLAGRWDSHNPNVTINASTDRMELVADSISDHRPVLLRGLRVDKSEITFAVRRVGAGSNHSLAIAFNSTDQDDYDYLKIWHTDTNQAPHGFEVIDGALDAAVTETSTDANMPSLISSDVLWVRVTNDGTTVSVKCATSEAGLGSASDCYSSTAFDSAGGLIGFMPGAAGITVSIDDLTIKADRDGNGSYETTEHVDDFTLDGSGYAEANATYDLTGNVTYDGVFSYTYDAWNRLVKVTKAYPDGPDVGSDPDLGSVIAEIEYDSLGNRIIKQVKNSADLDFTYHYYYDADNLVESRNGSDQVIKQYVWGVLYIDELIQVGLNDDPADATEDNVESLYYALHETNYSVAALVDDQGVLVERYQYAAYGRRTVYFASGANDTDAYVPTATSRRWQVSSVDQPYGLSEIGFQGLLHEDETDLVYNRARMLHPSLGRFMQRDPLGYPDGLSSYASYHIMGGGLDPSGLRNFTNCEHRIGQKLNDLVAAARRTGEKAFATQLVKMKADLAKKIRAIPEGKCDPCSIAIVIEALKLWLNDPGKIWGQGRNNPSFKSKNPVYADTVGRQYKCNIFVVEAGYLGCQTTHKAHQHHANKSKWFPYRAKQWGNPNIVIPGYSIVNIKKIPPNLGDIMAIKNHVGICLGNNVYISARISIDRVVL